MEATMDARRREAIQDIWYGQLVTIIARWFFIGAGLVLTLWRAETIGEVTAPVYPLIALIAMNFLLHGRFLTGSPMRREVILASCAIDIAMISAVILIAEWDPGDGLASPYYVFYYPVVLGFALVFPWRTTLVLTAGALLAYAGVVLAATPDLDLGRSATYETVMARLVTLATTAVLGSLYWRVQRQYRRTRLEAN